MKSGNIRLFYGVSTLLVMCISIIPINMASHLRADLLIDIDENYLTYYSDEIWSNGWVEHYDGFVEISLIIYPILLIGALMLLFIGLQKQNSFVYRHYCKIIIIIPVMLYAFGVYHGFSCINKYVDVGGRMILLSLWEIFVFLTIMAIKTIGSLLKKYICH